VLLSEYVSSGESMGQVDKINHFIMVLRYHGLF
jgi:hypothetical protein